MPLVTDLVNAGWRVEAEGVRSIAAAANAHASVRSGIDWFDVSGLVSYDDLVVPVAELLAARRRGEDLFEFEDGTLGLMPNDWLDQFEPLMQYGEQHEGHTLQEVATGVARCLAGHPSRHRRRPDVCTGAQRARGVQSHHTGGSAANFSR